MKNLYSRKVLLLGAFLFAATCSQSQIISTIAGSSNPGDFIPAVNAPLYNPNVVAVDRNGYIVVTDYNNRIRRIDPVTGIITTIAGTGTAGFSGDGGVATAANLNNPMSICFDTDNNLYFSDYYNYRIRKISAATGIITTIAGASTTGYTGDGGDASTAKFNSVNNIAVDGSGNLYIADQYNNRIRKITAATNIITTIAGTGVTGNTGDGGLATAATFKWPNGVGVDGSGNVYITDGWGRVRKVDAATGIINNFAGNGTPGYSGDGGVATSAQVNYPFSVIVDKDDNVYLTDRGNYRIRKVAKTTGIITTVAGSGAQGFTGDGGAATSASFDNIVCTAVDADGNVFIADRNNNRIRKVTAATGIISTYAGTGATSFLYDNNAANTAALNAPASVAIDGSGNIYIADKSNNRIRKVTASTGIITTIAGTGTAASSGDGGLATAAQVYTPLGIAVDGSQNVYIAESSGHRIRKINALTGIITTIAGTGISGFSGDGGAATAAQISSPFSVDVDASGNILITDRGNQRIRKINGVTGIITTIAGTGVAGFSGDGGAATAAQLSAPYDACFDGNGNVYIADRINYRIRKIDAVTGIISSIAGTGISGFSGDGGAATAAQLNNPYSVDVDGNGNVIIADFSNQRIRRIDAVTGVMSTIVGTGTRGYNGDGLAATDAYLNNPNFVRVDGSGNIFIADLSNNRVRYICTASTLPSVYTTSQQTLFAPVNNSYLFNSGCVAISRVKPAGTNPVLGPVNDTVWVEPSVPTASGIPYVTRHYGITPTYNASTATGTITLFYTQADFTAYNASANHGPDLPVDATDALNNKANLRIIKRSGTSNNGTGLFDSYTGSIITITPTLVTWNNALNLWEVTFDVNGFSGFFVATNPLVALPLTLVSFEGKLANEAAMLSWKTADEKNTSYFDVERTTDGTYFTSVGRVSAAGNSIEKKAYAFTDETFARLNAAVVYYRLKMADKDGKFTYSKTIALKSNSQSALITLYPNPVHNTATLSIAANQAEKLQLQLIDQSGRILQFKTAMVQKGNNTIGFDAAHLPAGIYSLRIEGAQTHQILKLNKQ